MPHNSCPLNPTLKRFVSFSNEQPNKHHPPSTIITRNHKHQANTHNLQQTNNNHMQHLFPWPSTFETLLHTTFGSWWCCIINLGFHPPFTFHHTIFKNQQLWGPHVGHVFLPISLVDTAIYMSELGLPIFENLRLPGPHAGLVFLLTFWQSHMPESVLRFVGTFGYHVPMLGVCPPTRCHQCWLVAEFWPGYQVG